MEGQGFISADLNQDGRRDLAGSFHTKDPKMEKTYSLFLVAMGDESGSYRAEFFWYTTSIGDQGTNALKLVDTIDLDEDGTDELVVTKDFFEGSEYEILKRAGNKWKRVYRGGGSGC
jgi:hypothetical protein